MARHRSSATSSVRAVSACFLVPLSVRLTFHIHFTPTGSSWINQVERWFSYLTTQLLQRGVYKNVQNLEKDIRDWIVLWNADPKTIRVDQDRGRHPHEPRQIS
jgi:transposase